MLIHSYNIKEGDTIYTPAHLDGQEVKEVEVMESGSVRVKYITDTTEWFERGQLVVKAPIWPRD